VRKRPKPWTQRARVVLGCAAGKTNTVVARELWLTKQTVGKWRTRFLTRRLDGRWKSHDLAPADGSPMLRSSA
jgi:hypothetical protein